MKGVLRRSSQVINFQVYLLHGKNKFAFNLDMESVTTEVILYLAEILVGNFKTKSLS